MYLLLMLLAALIAASILFEVPDRPRPGHTPMTAIAEAIPEGREAEKPRGGGMQGTGDRRAAEGGAGTAAGVRTQIEGVQPGRGPSDADGELAALLSDRAAEAERESSARVEALSRQLDVERQSRLDLERQVVGMRRELAAVGQTRASGSPAAAAAVGDLPHASAGRGQGSGAGGSEVKLPPDEVERVSLRFARDDAAARSRAQMARSALAAGGLEVAEPVADSVRGGNAVTYFYGEDEGGARRVAEILALSRPVRVRAPADGPPPRPGTVEVAIQSDK